MKAQEIHAPGAPLSGGTARLRVLCVGHSYVLAVNRAVIRELARDPQFDITVAAPAIFQGDLRRLEMEPEEPGSPLCLVPIRTLGSRFIHLFRYDSAALNRLMAEGGFDLIQIWEEPYVMAGWQIARLARIHKIKYCFYSFQNLEKKYPLPFSWFERQGVKGMSGWEAGGELVFQMLVKRGYDPKKGEVMPPGVETILFKPLSAPDRQAVRDELGLKPPVIGFMGRLVPDKGIHVLQQALELLPPGLEWSALFLGSGPEEETIRKWISARGWSGRIHLKLARHDEVPRYLGAMDLLLAPSQTMPHWKEQFGRMLVEAFACGVPVVASDSGEIPHVVGDAGVILPEADAARWAQEIAALLADPARRGVLAHRGLERAQDFSAQALARKHATFYRKIAAAA